MGARAATRGTSSAARVRVALMGVSVYWLMPCVVAPGCVD